MTEQLSSDGMRQVFYEQYQASLDCRDAYAIFEKVECAEWSRGALVKGGVGNAGEFSEGLAAGDEEAIREGYGDLLWTACVCCHAYEINPEVLAMRFAGAKRDSESVGADDLLGIQVKFLDAVCAVLRFATVLDGERTLPGARESFEERLGDVVHYVTLAVPSANSAHGLHIDPEASFAAHIAGLEVRVALQTVYGQLREGLLGETEARELARGLESYAALKGLDSTAIARIWQKAPSRVRGMALRGFLLQPPTIG